MPVGGEIFRTSPDPSWGPPSLLYNVYRVFPAGKERPGRDADPSPPSSAVVHERVELCLLTLWAVRPVQSLSACTGVHFTFYFSTRNIYQTGSVCSVEFESVGCTKGLPSVVRVYFIMTVTSFIIFL
jgi:hypothetical protein